jgi:hypothetical protein
VAGQTAITPQIAPTGWNAKQGSAHETRRKAKRLKSGDVCNTRRTRAEAASGGRGGDLYEVGTPAHRALGECRTTALCSNAADLFPEDRDDIFLRNSLLPSRRSPHRSNLSRFPIFLTPRAPLAFGTGRLQATIVVHQVASEQSSCSFFLFTPVILQPSLQHAHLSLLRVQGFIFQRRKITRTGLYGALLPTTKQCIS